MQLNNAVPQTGFLRLSQIVGNPKATPPVPALIPVSRATWWQWVRDKKAPQSHKLAPRITAWKAEDIHNFLVDLGKGGAA